MLVFVLKYLYSIKALFGRKEAMNKFLDAEKALEAIVYVSHRTQNLFNIVKTLYFADKLHLQNYGRLITGDRYIAMEDGPVPSGAYDLIKLVRGDDGYSYERKIVDAHPEKAISAKKQGNETEVIPLREPRVEYLSESDIECLEEAIKLYAHMDGRKLWKIVHKEQSYNKTERNKTIPLAEMVGLDIPNGKDVLQYLNG